MYQDFNDYENFVPLQPLDNMTRACGCSQQQQSGWNQAMNQNLNNQAMPSPMNIPMQNMQMGMPTQPMGVSPQMQAPQIPQMDMMNMPFDASGTSLVLEQDEITLNNPMYTQGYLQSKIGKYMKVEFLIGTDMWVDREGILAKVGISYIVLTEADTRLELMCDIYSIKFVRIANVPPINPLAPNSQP